MTKDKDGETREVSNIENYITVTLAIMSLVLPSVKKYVQAKMESHFKMLKLVEDNKNPRQGLTCDPLKP